MWQLVTHEITSEGGMRFVRDKATKTMLSADELECLIGDLADTLKSMRQNGLMAEEVADISSSVHFYKSVLDCTFYPGSVQPFMFIAGDQSTRPVSNRMPSVPRYRGVYFLKSTGRPGLIKIGQTRDLFARSRMLYNEFKRKSEQTLLAFLQTDKQVELERMTHRYFRECHVRGDWFHDEPIHRFLSDELPTWRKLIQE